MSYLGRSAKLSLKAQEKVSFLATAGQTAKTGLSYVPSFVEVYVNGILLTDTTDFTATNGNSVTFTVALALNDEVTVISLKTFTVADHYTKTEDDALLAAKATNTAVAAKAPIASPSFTGTVAIGHTTTSGSTFAICDGANSQIQFFPEISTDTNLTQHYDPTASAYINAETRAATHAFKTGTTERMRIENNGFLLNNGMKTVIFSFNIGLSSTTNFDFTIPNDVNYFEIKAIIGYYPGIDYTASIHGLYAYRSDAGIVRVQNFNDSSSANSGSWAVSNPNNTTIRVRKNGGNSTSGARGFIEVKYREA